MNKQQRIADLSSRYEYAVRNYSTSYMQMFRDDAYQLASQLQRLGVTTEQLTTIWNSYHG